MHWADKFAGKLLVEGKEHVVETGTSISGVPQIGNASDVIRGDAIIKALTDKGVKPRFLWVADDSDPFRKTPAGFEDLTDYLGHPVNSIPDHDGCHKNFVEHFVEPFLSDLSEFGVKPEHVSASELYQSGGLYEETKTALEKRGEVVEILNEFRADPLPLDFIPWHPVCESCGKISTAKPTLVEGDIVKYACSDVFVSGGDVAGCGHEGENDIKEGKGKLPWRVEWAARWHHFKVTCEPLGKDHASSGGSYWTSKIISEKIFDHPAPVPVIYEFFTLNGAKISSSKGNVITLSDWLRIAEPEVLKHFMYKKLNKQRDINLASIPALADEYDKSERIFYGEEDCVDEHKRMFELSQVGKSARLQVPFTLCAVLAQIIPDPGCEAVSEKVDSMGYTKYDKDRLARRVTFAGNWVREYGPEYLRFALLEDASYVKEGLSEGQRSALSSLSQALKEEKNPGELHKKIYGIARENEIEPPELFKAIYLSLIGKEKGPKAASFLLALDKEFIKARFDEVSD